MSGNPNPQHTPTDGLGVAAKITVGSASGGTLAAIVAGREYTWSMSLALGAQTATLAIKDIAGNAYSPSGNCSAVALCAPATSGYFKPSNFTSSAPAISYNAHVATVAVSSTNDTTLTVTPVAVGQCVVEISFPTFDNTVTGQGSPYDGFTPQNDKIFALINLTVTP